MMYAPRAIRHFSLAAMEGRAERTRAVAGSPHHPRAKPTQPLQTEPVQKRVVVRLWLPTTFIFLLLAPFALLLAPLIYFAPRPYGARPFATVIGVGQVLLTLGGTVVEVDTPEALVHIRVF